MVAEKFRKKLSLRIMIFIFLLILFYMIKNLRVKKLAPANLETPDQLKSKLNRREKLAYVRTRDFIRYDCLNMKRVGGMDQFVRNAPHSLFRIDGAWFVCLDRQLQPEVNNCNVISLGVNTDFSFDEEMNAKYGCMVHSFDPIIEAPFFNHIREKKKLFGTPVVDVNDKWKFYKIGISNVNKNSVSKLSMGSRLDFRNILKLTDLEYKIIDIFKMDIEGEEKDVLDNFDMQYACKYIKQIMFETHKNFRFGDLVKLEECFYLFYRHTRFFMGDLLNQPTGLLTEFQNPTGFKLNLALFHNETDLAEYMFVNGEFYFANENFF